MKAKQGDIALITSGMEVNIGKLVYVVGVPEDKRLPSLGGGGKPYWDIQMLASPLIDIDGHEVIRGFIADDSLVSLDIEFELAESHREDAIIAIMAPVVAELVVEEEAAKRNVASRPCFFVTNAGKRSAIRDGALRCEMSTWCTESLKAIGYTAPVPFSLLANKYWWAEMDAASENPHLEPGGCTISKIATTEEIAGVLCEYYVKVKAGPFDSPQEVNYAIDIGWD